MNQNYSDQISKAVRHLAEEKFSLPIKEFISARKNFSQTILNEIQAWYESLKTSKLDQTEIFLKTEKLHDNIEKKYGVDRDTVAENDLSQKVDELLNSLLSSFENLPEVLIELQGIEHFTPSNNDKFILRILKSSKRIAFPFTKAAFKITHWKSKAGDYHWERRIPFRLFVKSEMGVVLSQEVIPVLAAVVENTGKLLIDQQSLLRETDRKFTANVLKGVNLSSGDKTYLNDVDDFIERSISIIANYDKIIIDLSEKIEELIEKRISDLRKKYEVIDTIELSARHYSKSKFDACRRKYRNKIEEFRNNKNNYFDVIFFRTEFFEDISWFTYNVLGNAFNMMAKTRESISGEIKNNFIKLRNTLKESQNKIRNAETNEKVVAVINEQKAYLQDMIDQKYVSEMISQIPEKSLGAKIEDYLSGIEAKLNEFSKEYIFIRQSDFYYGLKAKDIKKFSPKDVLRPIIYNKLHTSLKEIKEIGDRSQAKVSTKLQEIGRIVEYNLEESSAMFNEKKEAVDECIKVAVEGLERAQSQCEYIFEYLQTKFDEQSKEINILLSQTLEELETIANVEKLLNLKLRVSKETALQKGRQKFTDALMKLKTVSRKLRRLSKSSYELIKSKFIGIKTRVGLAEEVEEISEAVADYLLQTSASFKKLPIVYQRLFSNEPLTSTRFFIGREKELQKLLKAFEYWKNERLSSVVLVGDKGEGTSSIINIAIENFGTMYSVIKKKDSVTIYETDRLLEYFVKLLELKNVNSFDDLIERINESEERKVVVIENLEDFYLRIVDGFEVLKKIFEIVSATNNKIFWVFTCNLYSWRYLNKVLAIKDYFVFVIELTNMKDEEIEQVILKRNSISGYNLKFIPSEEILNNKTYKKLNEEQKQLFVKKKYFSMLNQLSESNIAIAMFLWLRSIESINEEEIHLSTSIDMDFSFLKSLNDQKLFSLVCMVMHDGITLEEHNQIFNMTDKNSLLLLNAMMDDGIIFKRGERYKINFQLYRPITDLLMKKNILH